MRKKLAEIVLAEAKKDKKIIFLTGDLGFNFFEGLRQGMGKRFINAGVAEQNMATVAAGLAYSGLKPWIFSIAPFVSLKILEELRDDICLNNSNVKIIGLGGGYDYELAGPTHHALEDVGVLLTLPNMKIYLPAVIEDVAEIIKKMNQEKGPRYLRLVRSRKVALSLNKFEACRQVLSGDKVTVLALGSIIDKAIEASLQFKGKIDLWVIGEMPFRPTQKLLNSITKTGKLMIIEEHMATGGLGQFISLYLHKHNIKINNFIHLYAKGYVSKKTGSRDFYLKESELGVESIIKAINGL